MPEPSGAQNPAEAVGNAGAGGVMDLAAQEAGTLAVPPGTEPEAPVTDRPRSLWSDAWRDLRRNPVFIISALVILVPGLHLHLAAVHRRRQPALLRPRPSSQAGPAARAPLRLRQPGLRRLHPDRLRRPRLHHWSASAPPRGVALLGGVLGGLAGFFGGWWDALLSRISDVFFGIPIILGGLVFLSVVTGTTVWPVIGFIVLLGWPQIARIARGSVITAKQNDYVQAARALGASNSRILLRHITPNAVAPVIVVATIALGTYISLEATLSYLGVGLQAADGVLGHRHLRGLHPDPQRPAHAAVAGRRAEHHRAGVHHARRRGARRPRPEAALRRSRG